VERLSGYCVTIDRFVAGGYASLVMKYEAIGVPANFWPIRRAKSSTEFRSKYRMPSFYFLRSSFFVI
jgi:hypothetical protein